MAYNIREGEAIAQGLERKSWRAMKLFLEKVFNKNPRDATLFLSYQNGRDRLARDTYKIFDNDLNDTWQEALSIKYHDRIFFPGISR